MEYHRQSQQNIVFWRKRGEGFDRERKSIEWK
jgi:hypothetical protein